MRSSRWSIVSRLERYEIFSCYCHFFVFCVCCQRRATPDVRCQFGKLPGHPPGSRIPVPFQLPARARKEKKIEKKSLEQLLSKQVCVIFHFRTFDSKSEKNPQTKPSIALIYYYYHSLIMKIKTNLLLLFSCATTAVAQLDCSFQEDITLTDGFSLRQVINQEEQSVTVQLTYQGQGWIGMGFGTAMVGSVAVIGVAEEPPALYSLGSYSLEGVTKLENQAALIDSDFTQTDSESVLTFTRSLTENGETLLTAGEETSIIVAYGMTNTLDYHEYRGTHMVTFTECVGPDTTPAETVTNAPDPMPTPVPTASPAATDGRVSIGNGVTMYSEANVDEGTVFFEIVYEGQGWIGFGTSPGQSMIGSEVVIGVPDSEAGPTNPGKYALSERSLNGVNLLPNEQQTLIDAIIEQNETHTVLRFTKLMEEDGEHSISATEPNPFTFATGINNVLGNHNQRATFMASVGGGASGFSSEPRRRLWAAHGAMMAISWGILVPLAISFSLLRDLIPGPEGLWFKFHFFLNSLAIIFTTIGFAIAVYAINDQSEGDPGHFQGPPKHRLVGLIVFLLVIIQALIAAFRPHPPQSANNKDEENAEQPKEKSTLRFIWEIKHRLVGFTLLGLSWYNVDSGLHLFADLFQEDQLATVFWGVVGSISCLAILLFAYAKLGKGSD